MQVLGFSGEIALGLVIVLLGVTELAVGRLESQAHSRGVEGYYDEDQVHV